MSDRPLRFSRPSFGIPDPAGRSDAPGEDSTILRRNLCGTQEPARPQGTDPSTYDAASRAPRQTDESVWEKPARTPAMPSADHPGSARSAYSAPSVHSAVSAASQASAASPPAASAVPAPPRGPDQGVDDLMAQYTEGARPSSGRRHRVRVDGETLDVPLPGHRLSSVRGRAVAARAVAIGALVVGLAGLAVTGGFLTAIAARNAPDPTATAPTDQWNAQAAQAFGANYLRTCLSRPRSDERAETQRIDQLRAMNVGGLDEACRAQSTDTKARVIGQPVFTGQTQPVTGMPRARFLEFTVDVDKVATNYVVPVYLDVPATGSGPSVVGRIGVSPLGGYGIPAENAPERVADDELTTSLRAEFLPHFMTAWAMSSASLPQFLATEHTEEAEAGLAGAVNDLQISDVRAYPRREIKRGDHVDYADGDVVDVIVTSNATLASGAPQPESHRLVLERSNGKWFVKDARGGSVDHLNGAPTTGPSKTPR